jgi:P4 family phage/plasmid primase-like protien
MKYYEDTHSVKCHKCGFYGDVFSYWAEMHKLDVKRDFPQVFKGVCDDLGIFVPDSNDSHNYVQKGEVKEVKSMKVIQTNENEQLKLDTIHSDIVTAQHNAQAFQYLTTRGIPESVQKRFGTGYIQNWATVDTRISANFDETQIPSYKFSPRLIIPTSDYSYLARDIRPTNTLNDSAKQYTKIKMGKVNMLNLNSLKDGTPIFITEGEITMFSAIAVGYEAISLGSTSMINQFFNEKYYEIVGNGSKYDRPVLILCFDGDNAGVSATNKALSICKQKNIPAIKLSKNFYDSGKYNDLNDILIANPDLLKSKLTKEFNRATNFNYNMIGEVTQKENVRKDLPPFVKARYNQLNGQYTYSVVPSELAKYILEHETFKFELQSNDSTVIKYVYDKQMNIYKQLSDIELNLIINDYITQYDYALCTKHAIQETAYIINSIRGNYVKPDTEFNSNEDIVCFQDGVYNIMTEEFEENSPENLCTIQLKAKFKGHSLETPEYDKFSATLCNGDKNRQQLLLEAIGLAVSNVYGYRFKKAFMMYGAGDTGKTTIRNVIDEILGLENVCASSMCDLERRFGLSAVFNKRLVGSAEMNATNGGEMNIFKSLTGSDALPLEMKNKGTFSYHFKGMIWFCCNHLPEVSSKHQEELYNRLILFPCTNVIPDNQKDKRLKDKLLAERTGIIIKALKALKEAIKRGYKFTMPNECIKAKEEYMLENNPLALFMEECTTERPSENTIQDNCTTKKLYDVFKAWCTTYGFLTMNIIQFRKLLAKHFNVENVKDLIKRTAKNTYYKFTLNLKTKQDFVQVYGMDSVTSSMAVLN